MTRTLYTPRRPVRGGWAGGVSGLEGQAETGGARARQDDGRRGDILHADAGQIAQCDLAVRSSPRSLPGGDLPQLAGDLALGDGAGGDGVMDLPEPEALRPAVGDDQIGASQDLRVELLLVGSVRSDRGD